MEEKLKKLEKSNEIFQGIKSNYLNFDDKDHEDLPVI